MVMVCKYLLQVSGDPVSSNTNKPQVTPAGDKSRKLSDILRSVRSCETARKEATAPRFALCKVSCVPHILSNGFGIGKSKWWAITSGSHA
jgi:hypothetical protein